MRDLISKASVLAYYDAWKPLTIHSDASHGGIGAVLLQGNHPMAYTSRALTPTEVWYSIIEKEMFAVVFTLEKWHHYTIGHPVKVYSDHKPLEPINKNLLKGMKGKRLVLTSFPIGIPDNSVLLLKSLGARPIVGYLCHNHNQEIKGPLSTTWDP